MKKFLTMLLALSVVFTYTVGTAFAAGPAPAKVDETKTANYNTLLEQLNDAKDATVKGLDADIKAKTIGTHAFGAPAVTVDVPKSVYESVANMVYADYAKILLIALYNAPATDLDSLKNYEVTSDDDANLAGRKFADIASDVNGKFKGLVYGKDRTVAKANYEAELVVPAFAAEKEKALAELAKVDLSLYSDDVMPATEYKAFLSAKDENVDKVTYAQAANMKLETLKKAVNDAVITTKDKELYKTTPAGPLTLIGEKFNAVKDTYGTKNLVVEKEDSYKDVVTGETVKTVLVYSLKDLAQKATLDGNKATLEAAKLAKKAEAQAKAAEFISKPVNKDKGAEKDAYLEVVNYLIDQCATVTAAQTYKVPEVTEKDYVSFVATYNEKVADAAAKKLEKNLDGSLAYDAEKIDVRLAEMKADIYKNGSTGKTFADCTVAADDFAYEMKVLVAKVEAAKEAALMTGDEENYYALEKAQVVAIYDKVIADLNNVADAAHKKPVVDKYFDGADVKPLSDLAKEVKADLPAINSVVDGKVKALPAYNTEKDAVAYYVKDVLNAGLNPWNDNYRDTTAAINDLYKFYAEKGARTDAEVKALRQDAIAMVAALPTQAEKAAMKADAEALVKAIPARLALENKAQVVAAYEAAVAAKDAGVAIDSKLQAILDRAIAEIEDKEAKVLDEMMAKLPAVKVTAADKEAVKAIIAAVEAYDESKAMYGANYDSKYNTAVKTTSTGYEDKMEAADKKAVEAAIANLSKDSNKAEVEAARALYDAYVAEYTDLAAGTAGDVRKVIGLDKLLYVEAQVKANEIAAVESVKVKASSKAYKGAIRVNWTVKGDKDAVDGYEVFRSVKKNSGFGTKAYFKTTKTTYKNTKALKKGTRYYYKVRAYKVVDGKKYYSDWSNKAYRVAK